MGRCDEEMLRVLAQKYVWWKSPEEALRRPQSIIAQVMNLGDYDDAQALANQLGDHALREALIHAEPGQFSARSWVYWHYRLGLAGVGEVPPPPARTFR